ncbi:hypothetical protein E4T56_gene9826 [Termitomyces sp. T112]|nr:hypothetical protein E4T56_gene9826 [Termitomyces sp. T112]
MSQTSLNKTMKAEITSSVEQHCLPPGSTTLSINITDRIVLERQLVRKLDSRLLPTIMLIYLMNFIDRANITAARLQGLQDDLHISDVQYDTVLAILMAEDTGEADKDHSKEHALEGLKMALKDPLVYIFAIQTTFGLIGLSFSSFFPTLTKTLGFSTTTSLLLAAPPWLFAAILCCLNAWHADRTGERFFHIAGWFWVIIVGSVIGISSMSVPARYVSFFFMTCGNAGSALNLVWVSNAIPRPPIKRAAAIGFVSSAAALGSLTGSYVWKSEWGPSYRPSMMILIGALVISTSLQFVIRNMLIRKNARLTAEGDAFEADRIRVEEAAKLQGITYEDALERRKRFQYLY